jgi:hypothetical protein
MDWKNASTSKAFEALKADKKALEKVKLTDSIMGLFSNEKPCFKARKAVLADHYGANKWVDFDQIAANF